MKTEVVTTSKQRGNLYFLHVQTIKTYQVNAVIIKRSWNKWHHLLGHISQEYINHLIKYNIAIDMNIDTKTIVSQCKAYI